MWRDEFTDESMFYHTIQQHYYISLLATWWGTLSPVGHPGSVVNSLDSKFKLVHVTSFQVLVCRHLSPLSITTHHQPNEMKTVAAWMASHSTILPFLKTKTVKTNKYKMKMMSVLQIPKESIRQPPSMPWDLLHEARLHGMLWFIIYTILSDINFQKKCQGWKTRTRELNRTEPRLSMKMLAREHIVPCLKYSHLYVTNFGKPSFRFKI